LEKGYVRKVEKRVKDGKEEKKESSKKIKVNLKTGNGKQKLNISNIIIRVL
jgi:hypothetical protein